MAWKLKRAQGNRTDAHPVDQMMPVGQLLLYGLQHVMSMYAGVIAVPLIVGTAMGLPFGELAYLLTAALLVSGLATLLQTLGVWRIGARLPLVQGTSFAAVASMLAIGKGAGGGNAGLTAIFGAVLVAGVIGFLLTPAFNRLIHFFPPVVTGTIITVIGVSLLPVAVRWAAGGANSEHFGSPANIGLAGLTLLIILFIYRFLPGFFSRIAILAGLALGTLIAVPLGMANFGRIGQAPWFAVSTPFHFGFPTFEFAAILSMTIVMLVIMTETTADILAIGEIVGRPADGRTVVAGLRADTAATAISGGLLNGFPCSAFAQNVGLVAITGIKSRYVVAGSGAILLALGLLPKLGAIIASIPLAGARRSRAGPVRHGRGQRDPGLSRVDYEGNANLVIVAVALGMGVLPIAVPEFYEEFPDWFATIFDSGISAAAVTAVLLNLLFNVAGRPKRRGRPDLRRGPTTRGHPGPRPARRATHRPDRVRAAGEHPTDTP